MAKELPYFKFFVSEWNDGDITLESLEAQGLFINLCSYYWSNECNISVEKCIKKFRHVDQSLFNVLLESNTIKDENGQLRISFLDEQREERLRLCAQNAENVRKRYDRTTTVEKSYYENPTIKRREEEKREDKIEKRKTDFYKSLEDFLNEYSKDTLRDFFDYWSEHGENDKKMKFEKEKSFSIKARLKRWAKNDFNKTEKKETFSNNAHLFMS